jgi:hypothetical protein
MIVDPCYVDDHWIKKEYDLGREVRVIKTGEIIDAPTGFNGMTWEDNFPLDKKLTWNQAKAKGIIEDVPYKQTREFSYSGCCRATLNDVCGGELDIGGTSAVAFRSGFGDGVYPVYALKDEDGIIQEVRIKFN